jgi:hypothetical protein
MPAGPLNPAPGMHIMPTHAYAASIAAPAATPFASTAAVQAARVPKIEYWGGDVMRGPTAVVPIFWEPPHLQGGQVPPDLTAYNTLIQRFFGDVGGHGMYDVLSQYYEQTPGRHYIVNSSGVLTAVVDNTTLYPAAGSACSLNSLTNCVTDAQIQAEIASVITNNSLPTGFSTLYVVFTNPLEASCFDSKTCFNPVAPQTSWVYCAYHSGFLMSSSPVIYAYLPYIDSNAASIAGCAGGAPPVNLKAFDDESSAFSHEVSEAITDPDGFGWFDGKTGAEIADVCNQLIARVSWNGHPYVIQKEWSIATMSCEAGGGNLLTTSSTTGPPGSASMLSGVRFKAHEHVTLTYAAPSGHVTQLGTATADKSGAFTKHVNVPEDSTAGQGTFEAQGAEPGDGAGVDFLVAGPAIHHRPDGRIGLSSSGPFTGNGIYNITGARQHLHQTVARRHQFIFYLRFENDGNVADRYGLHGLGAPPGFVVVYRDGTGDVTHVIEDGSYRVDLAPGAQLYLQVVVKVKSGAAAGRTFDDKVLVTSRNDPTKRDAVIATTKVA